MVILFIIIINPSLSYTQSISSVNVVSDKDSRRRGKQSRKCRLLALSLPI